MSLSPAHTGPFKRDDLGKPAIGKNIEDLYAFGDLIRRTEIALLALFSRGLLSGTTHTCLGQELCQISVVRALDKPGDAVLSNHRNHGHFLAYSGDFLGLVAEIMGREAGVCGGYGGSQHIAHRGFHSNGVQGGMTAIAVGLALAARMADTGSVTAVIIGDGTLGEGLVYESMNLASAWQVPALFVVEHNGIAQTTATSATTPGSLEERGRGFGLAVHRYADDATDFVSSVDQVVQSVRQTGKPALLIIDTERLGPHSKGDDLRSDEEIVRIQSRDPLTALGRQIPDDVRAVIEERNKEFLAVTLTAAEQAPPSQLDRLRYSAYPLQPASHSIADDTGKTVREVLNNTLDILLGGDAKLIVLGEDIHDPYGGAFKVTAGLSTRYPERVLSTPISEAAIVGAGIGLALAGWRPVVELMFADFVTLALDQLYNHAVKFPALFGHALALVVRMPAGGGRGYGPTHSQSPESILAAVPGLTVVAPSHRHPVGAMLGAATTWGTPVAFMEHKRLYGQIVDPAGYTVLEPAPGEIGAQYFPTLVNRRDGADIAIVCFGGMLPIIEAVAARLEAEEELVVEIVVLGLLNPLPSASLAKVLAHHAFTFIVEEGPVDHGIGAEVLARLVEQDHTGVLVRLGAPPVPVPAARSLEDHILPSVNSIFQAIVSRF